MLKFKWNWLTNEWMLYILWCFATFPNRNIKGKLFLILKELLSTAAGSLSPSHVGKHPHSRWIQYRSCWMILKLLIIPGVGVRRTAFLQTTLQDKSPLLALDWYSIPVSAFIAVPPDSIILCEYWMLEKDTNVTETSVCCCRE